MASFIFPRYILRSGVLPRESLLAVSRRREIGLIALGIVGAALVILFVWQQASVDRLLVRIQEEKETLGDLRTEVDALSLEANRLSSLALVQDRAHAELGLVRPATDQIVELSFETTPTTQHFALRPLVSEAIAGVDEPKTP
jgi:cell division protein FtsB